jgi:ATPase subunit of ABC transporter with duplicated ATPase domains
VLRNIDVRVAGKVLIQDADLTLAYGRKYGLVGRNGAGSFLPSTIKLNYPYII